MAWYKKTLEDMKKSIESEDWKEVKKILQKHNQGLDKDAPEVEHDISSIGYAISKYGEDITQISKMLASQMKGSNTKDLMLAKVNSAIGHANSFERTIMHLVKERKFMK
jgi:hypothetical protein